MHNLTVKFIARRRRIRSIPFLPSSVPNLSLDSFIIHRKSFGLKFDPNGGFWFHTKFISRKSCQKLGFSDRWISNQYNLENVINPLIEIYIIGHLQNKLNPANKFSPKPKISNIYNTMRKFYRKNMSRSINLATKWTRTRRLQHGFETKAWKRQRFGFNVNN